MSELAEFVVVGNVNQGKSSIVATLIEDGAVPVADYPGTTTRSARYLFRMGGQDLFTIIDTPGFQDARSALAWLKDRAKSPGDRPSAVRALVEAFSEQVDNDRFGDEVRLLEPIMQGAGILYVVDASSRFQPTHEAEMEILRWTGQPAMALINRTLTRDHSAEWRPILEQFFNLVREFNAHDARFADRLELLSGFREIREAWRPTIDKALNAMGQEWIGRRIKSSQVLAELLVNAIGHVEKRAVAGAELPPGLSEELEASYRDRQRSFEVQARGEIERLYHHVDMESASDTPPLHKSDLFSELSWRLFGLDRTQLAKYGVGWGAALGGGLDLMVGGASFMTGMIGGAVLGGLGGYFASTHATKTLSSSNPLAKLLFAGETGQFLFKGPVTSPRYAWMLIDRALAHYQAVRDRSHARRDKLLLPEETGDGAGIAKTLDKELRDAIHKDLEQVLKGARRRDISQQVRETLATHLDEALQRI